MRLRNKQSGKIGYLYEHSLTQDIIIVYDVKGIVGKYKSLAELNEEWEDAPEEPKSINEIDVVLDAISEYCNEHSYYSEDLEKIRILNIVENKLKAFKRLKDKGFRFTGYSRYDWNGNESPTIAFEYTDFDKLFDDKQVVADLDLLFGGEE